ncbi:hypothetical protein Y032_0105g3701 [Ancylostoma ceylanicum]|uniref:Uncharacterized protein n=1 Tax=Ancylostoma ceylanicum TaxID=53326 RepID=A0A016TFI3_9BILA|nr:hypothetical protein Y032_0105g3701 [Ancylostoma ceylanicum]
MKHPWITPISYSPLLLLLRGNLRTCASIDIEHAKLPISISQSLIADGGAFEIGWQGSTVVLLQEYG